MCRSSLVVVVGTILVITLLGSISAAQDDDDPCAQQGIYLVNVTDVNLWYKRDGGACTLWEHNKNNILIRPGERIELFSDLTCLAATCTEPLTYKECRSIDQNGNCLIKVGYGCRLTDA